MRRRHLDRAPPPPADSRSPDEIAISNGADAISRHIASASVTVHAARQREQQPRVRDRLQQRDGDAAGMRQVVHERTDEVPAEPQQPVIGRTEARVRRRCLARRSAADRAMPPSAIVQSRVCSPSIRKVLAMSYVRISTT